MTPIAIKSFGLDQVTGLEKQLQVISVFCDARNEIVTVFFDIVLLAPTGVVASVLASRDYTRTGIKFKTLRESQIGVGITGLITADLDMINSFNTLESDLAQTTF